MSFGITVNNDSNHTLTFDKNTLARRNEANVSVTVTVPAAVFALGSFAYVDFLLPDGTAYYKGDYDPSSGSFTFTLGSADVILQQDGRVGIQFVLRDAAVNPTVVWKSELKYALVGASADATAQALTGIPASATFPVTFPAANTSITDAGTYFASPDVEDALQEVGADIVALVTATTAANLLTAIKSVDGAGSGLDADTLDGNSSAYFAVAANLPSKWYAEVIVATTSGTAVTFPAGRFSTAPFVVLGPGHVSATGAKGHGCVIVYGTTSETGVTVASLGSESEVCTVLAFL